MEPEVLRLITRTELTSATCEREHLTAALWTQLMISPVFEHLKCVYLKCVSVLSCSHMNYTCFLVSMIQYAVGKYF